MDNADAAGTDTTLRLRHRFEAPPERIFEAWTRPETLRRWWCPAGWHPEAIEVDLRVGGSYRISMWRPADAHSVTVRGRFLQIQPDTKLVYTWRWEGVFEVMPETRVTVEFRPHEGGTELALWQEELTMRYCALHLSGWLAAWSRIEGAISNPTTQDCPAETMPMVELVS